MSISVCAISNTAEFLMQEIQVSEWQRENIFPL